MPLYFGIFCSKVLPCEGFLPAKIWLNKFQLIFVKQHATAQSMMRWLLKSCNWGLLSLSESKQPIILIPQIWSLFFWLFKTFLQEIRILKDSTSVLFVFWQRLSIVDFVKVGPFFCDQSDSDVLVLDNGLWSLNSVSF